MKWNPFLRRLLPAAAVFLLLLAGCEEQADPRGQRMAVRGRVTLDGKPLDRATITFSSADGNNPVTATGSIRQGEYSIAGENGPLVGDMRVEIKPEVIDLAEFEAARAANPRRRISLDTVRIPPRYNTRSELTAIVLADEERNVFDFELKSR